MNVASTELLMKFVISLAMGAIIGIERERRARGTVFAGFRTFMLVCSLGLISAFLYSNFSQIFSALTLLTLGILCSINFYRKVLYKKEGGVTTETALLITYFIGFILYFESQPYIFSLALTFVLTMILFLKETLHEFAHKVEAQEVRDFLIFGLISFVIYPMLPANPVDPLGILNLKFVWTALVLILGLSFLAYTIIRLLKREGIILDAFLGGLINSIYMSNFFSSKFKEKNVIKYAILISLSSLLLRVFILSSVINFSNIRYLLFLPFSSIFGYLIGFNKLKKQKIKRQTITLRSPLDLRFALLYILVFVSIFYFANFLYIKLGKDYSYLLLPIGFIDTSSLTVTFSSILTAKDISKFLLLLVNFNILGNFFIVYRNNKEIAKNSVKTFLTLIFATLIFFVIFNYW